MKLKATVIIKSEYHGEGQSDAEIIQGYINFLVAKINLDIDSMIIEEDKDEN